MAVNPMQTVALTNRVAPIPAEGDCILQVHHPPKWSKTMTGQTFSCTAQISPFLAAFAVGEVSHG
jgi:fructoselysine-6-P-deglycase FrlB-like protein